MKKIAKTGLWLAAASLAVSASQAAQFKFPNQTLTVPDGFVVELAAGTNLVQRPVSVDYDEQGRLYVTDSSGSNEATAEQLKKKPHRILRLEDTDGDGRFDRSGVFADHLMFPEGALWFDGSLYVSAPPSIWKFTDTNNDGVADVREEWHEGKTLTGCANDLHGPYLGPDGWIYWCKGAFAQQTYEIHGKQFTTKAAHIFRARPDHSELEPVLTGGMDNPVGVAFAEDGERFLAGTFFEPGGGKRDGVIHAIYGGVYGKPNAVLEGHKRTGDLMPVMIHLGPAASASVISYRSKILGDDFQGNLFVANFNLHSVTRHILQAEGADFKTRDSVFLSSDNTDFHPTCVLEDADGSLLVVDTGGWYKICCPTSQLYKPDMLGAIYRIRKQGTRKLEDPRGLKINWAGLTPSALDGLLADERVYVRTRAVHELAKRGSQAFDAIVAADRPASSEARRNELWAATQIDAPSARKFVRRALADKDETTRSVALHSISLWRDKEALPQLLDTLKDSSQAMRRIAAEAVGRIGDNSAVPALLEAAGQPSDRILEHSIIYALIEIDDPVATAKGLEAAGGDTRRSAFIALDQMDNGDLRPERVTPLLVSSDQKLKQTASWIISHHNDWGPALAGFFRERISTNNLNSNERAELESQLAEFAHDPSVQDVLSEGLRAGPPETQLTVLHVIAEAALKKVPPAWKTQIARSLASKDTSMSRAAVLAALRISPKPPELSAALLNVARDESQPLEVRLNALNGEQNGKLLEGGLFDLCIAQLEPSRPVLIRGLAVAALSKAKLNQEQLGVLSASLKSAGPLEVSRLLGVFGKSTNEAVGLKLIADLHGAKALSSLRSDELKALFAKYSPAVRQKAEPLIASLNVDAAQQAAHIDQLLATLKDGDIRRGQALFNSAKLACSSCHSIGYIGGNVGPDLTRVGQVRTVRDLLEAVVYPSASFVRSFEPMAVVTKSGDDYYGIVKKDAADEIILRTGPNSDIKIPRGEVADMRPGKVSVMPAGLSEQMTPAELADLIAFLKATRW